MLTVAVWGITAALPSNAAAVKSSTDIRYQVIDLGSLPPVADDVAARINNSGEISFWRATADGMIHAFALNGASAHDLGTLNGYASSISRALNGQGQIVGWSVSGKNLVDSLATTHAFVYSESHMRDLGTLGGAR